MDNESLQDFAEVVQGYCKLLIHEQVCSLIRLMDEHDNPKVRIHFLTTTLQASNKLVAKSNTLKYTVKKSGNTDKKN